MIQGKLPDMNYDPRCRVFSGCETELKAWMLRIFQFPYPELDPRIFNIRFMIKFDFDLLLNHNQTRTYEILSRGQDRFDVYGLVQ